MATTTKIKPRALVRASGGPRYAVALAVDALGTGLLRPFLLLYGVTVLRLSAPTTGIAMTVGVVVGLVCMPAVGRWLDRGARSTVVAASMLVRVLGVALLLATPAGHVWLFATAALFLGIGNQAWPAAHAALVATVAHGRERDAALAGGRALRNAGLGAGALLAAACLAGGTTALHALAAVTGLGSKSS
jgi:predicted MFS family arabinose efflux permease